MNALAVAALVLAGEAVPPDAWRFGAAIVVVEDRDRDGIGELAISQPVGAEGDPGRIWIVSPVSGEVLALWEGEPGMGDDLAWIDDLDGDGWGEVAAAHGVRSGFPRTVVSVLSGRNGSVLRRVECPGAPASFPRLERLPDVDGDGVRELGLLGDSTVHAISVAEARMIWSAACEYPLDWIVLDDERDAGAGRILVLEWADARWLDAESGLEIARLELTRPGELVAGTPAGDADGDERADAVVVEAGPSADLLVVSGCGGEALARFDAGTDCSEECALFSVGDLDGNGLAEIVLGNHGACVALGSIHVFELPDGRPRLRVDPPAIDHRWHFGARVMRLADVDGDGVIDLLVGEDHRWSHQPGIVNVVSGRDGRILRELRAPL